MAYIFRNLNIKEKRVKLVVDKIYNTVTKLLVLQERAEALVDKDTLTSTISSLSEGILPFGDELVLNWKIDLDYESLSQFVDLSFDADYTSSLQEITYNKEYKSILKPDYASNGEKSSSTISILPVTKAKLYNGLVSFPNIEKYDFDYMSYELINEMYRATRLILDSTENFYSTFYYIPMEEFDNVYDDSARRGEYVIVYDTREMDEEIDGRINTQAQLIADPVTREQVMDIYRTTRDLIKFFCMEDVALKLENYIEELLFCVNGTKNYDIKFNQALRALVVQSLEGASSGEYIIKQHDEEVFFPFHNKALLDQFTEGFKSIW